MKNVRFVKKVAIQDNGNGFYYFETVYGKKITNKIGKYIIENLESANNLEELIENVDKQFNVEGNPEDVIKNFLYELQNLGIVEFQREQAVLDKTELSVAGESMYKTISRDIVANLPLHNMLYSATYDAKYYNVYYMRARSFSNKENYFFSVLDGKLSIIGVQNIDVLKAPAVVSLIKYAENLQDVKTLFDKMCLELKRLKQYKVKIVIDKKNMSDNLKDFLEYAGFVVEGVLIKEDGENDFVSYGKIL